MGFVIDPAIATKIQKMKQRVRWQELPLRQRGIDQTRLVLDDGREDSPEFSFLVIGDSGSGPHRGHNPQRRIAERMLPHRNDCRFLLHTGDVIYLVGSSEYYPKNFIQPYREFLVGGDVPDRIPYDQMVFNLPFLPVPGNHDYYDLHLGYGILIQTTWLLRRLLRSQLDLDIGWHGSEQGNAYARAFLDYLKGLSNPADLERHLEAHYSAKTPTGFCLRYQPGHFTRLPNRYYTFRSGGIDFFALDSNTFNDPIPLPASANGQNTRQQLEAEQANLDRQMQQIVDESTRLNPQKPEEAEHLDDLQAKLEQLQELRKDVEKQLAPQETTAIDQEQLQWLQQRLIESWQTESVRGRVLFFHHPPYVTEATKWHQAQTLAIRYRLRQVLDRVAEAIGDLPQGQPIVDLVLNGHAHCLEYLQTLDTGHADAHTNWLVCGGSGYSLRRQRQEGPEITERSGDRAHTVAKSHLFVGRTGHGLQKRRPYSFVRIDVKDGRPPKFIVRPYVSERFQQQWSDRDLEAFVVG
jgi:3',5'-cyclic AMP phosphodiesterase CpdA